MYSNPILIRLRSGLRSIGILKLIQASPLYHLFSQGYESGFDAAMMASLQSGMRVFDIGANVGFYTQKFAEVVGPAGEVHAFEPVPASAAKLSNLQQQYPWVHVHPCAIADKPGEVVMNTVGEFTSPNHMVAIEPLETDQVSLKVQVQRVDDLSEQLGIPELIKIDVEGYEWHVLRGADVTLSNPKLKYVFVEIHFKLLEKRGLPDAPGKIQSFLKAKGFNVAYTDFSHLYGWRV